eukprot:08572.XXX_80227_80364_1 [CDS] Oithona nana genome sequencing.
MFRRSFILGSRSRVSCFFYAGKIHSHRSDGTRPWHSSTSCRKNAT